MDDLTAATSHFDRRALGRAACAEREFDAYLDEFNRACAVDCSARAGRDAGEAPAQSSFSAALNSATAAALADWPTPAPAPQPLVVGETEFLVRFALAVAADQQARARVLVADLLSRADRASLPRIVPLHQRIALELRRAARRAREQILSLLRARLRAPHLAALARLQRAGRVLPRQSAGPKISDC